MEKRLKLVLTDWDTIVFILFPLVFLPAKADLVSKKENSKKNLVGILDSGSSKIIFTLLIEVIVFHVGFTIIYVWRSGLQGPISRFFGGGWDLNFQNRLKNPL